MFKETNQQTVFATNQEQKNIVTDVIQDEIKKIFKTDENGNLIKVKRKLFGKDIYVPRFRWSYVIMNLGTTLAILAKLYEEFAKNNFNSYKENIVENNENKEK
jgi:hypothetical protein